MPKEIKVQAKFVDGVSPGLKKVQTNSDRSFKAMQSSATKLTGAVKGMVAAYIGIQGIRAVSGFMEESARLAKIQEEAELELTAALRSKNAQFVQLMPFMKAYASELQQQTIYGDEALLSLMAYGANLGVQTNQLKEATKAAIGLAEKYRLDLNSAMQLVGRASQGQTQMLTRYGIVLGEGFNQQEKFNAVLKLGADAFALAEERTKSATGELQQNANALGDIQEKLGDKVIPLQLKFNQLLLKSVKLVSKIFGLEIQSDIEKMEEKAADLREQIQLLYDPVDLEKAALRASEIKLYGESVTNAILEQSERYKNLVSELIKVESEIARLKGEARKAEQEVLAGLDMSENGGGGLQQGGKQRQDAVKNEFEGVLALTRELEDNRLSLIQDARERERAELIEEHQRRVMDEGDTLLKLTLLNQSFFTKKSAMEKKFAKEDANIRKEGLQFALSNAVRLSGMFQENNRGMFNMTKMLAAAEATVNTYKAITEVVANPILAASVAALGFAQVAKIMATEYKAALGADFITNGPTRMMVGDNPGGRERVQVTPLSSSNIAGPQGSPVNIDASIIIQGNATPEIVAMIEDTRTNQLAQLKADLEELQFVGQMP